MTAFYVKWSSLSQQHGTSSGYRKRYLYINEGGSEHSKWAVSDNRQGAVLQLQGWTRGYKRSMLQILHSATGLDEFFG